MDITAAKSSISRRALLRGMAATGAVLAALTRGRAGLAAVVPGRTMTVYLFDPAGEGGVACSCKACLRHAEHKRFASRQLAETRRAHPGCKCAIRARAVSRVEFDGLFGRPSSELHTVERDLRLPRAG